MARRAVKNCLKGAKAMNDTVSAAGLDLIKEHEGFRAEPIQLPNGAWLVGYGHVRMDEAGAAVTEAEADALLAADVAAFARLVNESLLVSLSQAQFDALVSFAMSVGAEAFGQSQVLRRVNAGEHFAAACAIDAWRKCEIEGEPQVIDALVRRRALEKALYLKDVAINPAPAAFLRAELDFAAAVLGAPIVYAPAPALEHARPAAARPEPAARLTEILMSEPATEVLLLTQVVSEPEAEAEAEAELVTAHAKPVARQETALVPAGAGLREIQLVRLPKNPPPESFWTRVVDYFDLPPALFVAAPAALVLLGLAAMMVGVSLLLDQTKGALQIAGALALVLPGAVAAVFGARAFEAARRAPMQA